MSPFALYSFQLGWQTQAHLQFLDTIIHADPLPRVYVHMGRVADILVFLGVRLFLGHRSESILEAVLPGIGVQEIRVVALIELGIIRWGKHAN